MRASGWKAAAALRCASMLVAVAFWLIASLAAPPVFSATTAPGASSLRGPTFAVGDVFAGIGNGRWNHFDSSGTLLATLDDGHIGNLGAFEPPHATSGMCFDPAGNMFAVNLANNSMSKFDNKGSLLLDSIGTFSSNPEACLVAGGNTIYTSQASGTGDILKLDLAGAELARYDARRSDWIDLAADGCTMLYTDEGRAIHRFNVCTNTTMADFAIVPSGGLFALRVLPDGSVLVAARTSVQRFDNSGAPVSTYTAPGENYVFALNLDPDGVHFWTAGLQGKTIYEFNLDPAGSPVVSFDPQIAAGGGTGLAGLAIFGEPVASQAAAGEQAATSTFPAIVVALVVLLAVLALIVIFVMRRTRRTAKST